tara:strand:- start:24 stop:206 length:183 start_codon:yes stop_codon:yes gene_type:complete
MFEKINFQNKLWRVVAKVEAKYVDDPSSLKANYMCDMVLKSNQNVFFMLDEIIDAEFTEI